MRAIKDLFIKMPIGERVLLLTMALTVLFFFTQSALPRDISSAESDKVSEMLEWIIPSDTPIGGFIHENIRKIGHFAEYGLLGIEMAFFIWFYTKRKLSTLIRAASSALFIAFSDETIQIFSGRGPSISDVWLDFSGFLTLGLLTVCVLLIFYNIKRKNI